MVNTLDSSGVFHHFNRFARGIDHKEFQQDLDRDIKKYRFESFCYGPKSCKHYKLGRTSSVPLTYKKRKMCKKQ
ncbi:hypothetical protein ISALK_01660 [Isachenkonia alkalipeptolytica]|uniref:Uncharacterized protein n=1 Tax=Isachenkonia alkalipeptolytica TaxID=2565777 RepID=A0AA43XI11_9CLOT|nr:hypothetical protein [Isachenkonia alkalipeptolytica]